MGRPKPPEKRKLTTKHAPNLKSTLTSPPQSPPGAPPEMPSIASGMFEQNPQTYVGFADFLGVCSPKLVMPCFCLFSKGILHFQQLSGAVQVETKESQL